MYSLDDLKKKRNEISKACNVNESKLSTVSSAGLSTVRDLKQSLGLNKQQNVNLDRKLNDMSKATLPEVARIFDESKINLVFFFDKSSSCSGTEPATILGYNNLINKEKKEGLPTKVTTILFDGYAHVICNNEDIENIEPLNYTANGGTALYDTMTTYLRSIKDERQLSGTLKEKIIVVIMTDGKDEHSHKYRASDVRTIVDICKSYGWEFIFLGASEELKMFASKLGIDPDKSERFIPDANGYYLNFQAVSKAIDSYRSEGKIKPDWSSIIKQNNTLALESGKDNDGPTLRLGGKR